MITITDIADWLQSAALLKFELIEYSSMPPCDAHAHLTATAMCNRADLCLSRLYAVQSVALRKGYKFLPEVA